MGDTFLKPSILKICLFLLSHFIWLFDGIRNVRLELIFFQYLENYTLLSDGVWQTFSVKGPSKYFRLWGPPSVLFIVFSCPVVVKKQLWTVCEHMGVGVFKQNFTKIGGRWDVAPGPLARQLLSFQCCCGEVSKSFFCFWLPPLPTFGSFFGSFWYFFSFLSFLFSLEFVSFLFLANISVEFWQELW